VKDLKQQIQMVIRTEEIPASNSDSVEFRSEGVSVSIGVSVKFVVVLVAGSNLLAASVVRISIQLGLNIRAENLRLMESSEL
jgi:hypothetical protein